jgi:hypothetical protein
MHITMRRFCNAVRLFAILAVGSGSVFLAATAQSTGPGGVPGTNPAPSAPAAGTAAASTPATPNPGVAATDPSTAAAIQALRPALDNVSAVVAGLNIARWKAPGDVRSSTQQDVDSIRRDLSSTLPPLLDQAQGPGALAPSFAVYRNIDALYDVLLRVSEMASLGGSGSEAVHLEDARAGLEAARGQLGNSLLQTISAQDTQIVQLRAEAARAAAQPKPPEAPPSKIVVDDGPAPAPAKRKKKPATTTTPAPTTTTAPQK